MNAVISSSLKEAQQALNTLLNDNFTLEQIERAANLLVQVFERKGRVYSCGNGGSMCDAMHFAEELTGRYRENRPGLAAMAMSDPGHMSCVGNDYGYEFVFSRFVESFAQAGDCVVALSTSGKSRNIINAARAAQERGVYVIVLTGRHSPDLEALADVTICTSAGAYADRVQELHIKVLHILIELIERHFFPQNYRAVAA